ncbi:MAG: hypothetical protein AABX51_07000 [Nanoarchaeota archaeon]
MVSELESALIKDLNELRPYVESLNKLLQIGEGVIQVPYQNGHGSMALSNLVVNYYSRRKKIYEAIEKIPDLASLVAQDLDRAL